MSENLKVHRLDERHCTLKHWVTGKLDTWTGKLRRGPLPCLQGHLRSWEVGSSWWFLLPACIPFFFRHTKHFWEFFFSYLSNNFLSFFKFLKTRDNSSVCLSILRLFIRRNWLNLKHLAHGAQSLSCRRTILVTYWLLFCFKIARTWRHSDVIYDQPMVGTKFLITGERAHGRSKVFSI